MGSSHNRSTGFILEGFPQSLEDVQYLMDRRLLPDAAVVMEVETADVLSRLLPQRLDRWRERRTRKLEQQRKATELRLRARVRLVPVYHQEAHLKAKVCGPAANDTDQSSRHRRRPWREDAQRL